MGQAKLNRRFCAYCGKPATSADHVPPKGLFAKGTENLVTVPACDEHNNQRSGSDEIFRDFIATNSGKTNESARHLFESMVRRYRRSRSLRDTLRNRSKFDPVRNQFLIPFEAKQIREELNCITRGLYWHAYKAPLPIETEIRTTILRTTDGLDDLIKTLNVRTIGKDQFVFAFDRMQELPTVSVWVFVFHKRVVTMSITDEQLALREPHPKVT